MQRISRAVRVSAFLLSSALCAGAASAGPVFMQLEGIDVPGGSGEIEIQSFHWGPRQTTSADGSRSRTGHRVMMDDKADREKMGGHGGGGGTGANQMTMDDTAGKEKARRPRTVDTNETIPLHGGRTEGDPDRPIVAGTVPNTASKRQHGAVTISKEWGASTPQLRKPQDQGSVWIRVSSPWTACRVGARYPKLELGDGAATYRLSQVVVAGCSPDGVGFNYAKVAVRGWDPAR